MDLNFSYSQYNFNKYVRIFIQLIYRGISKLISNLASLAKLTIFESLTANLAASSRLSTGNIFNPELAIRTLASSTLVPCNRQIMGIFRFNSLAAAMIPSAMTSHLIIPPKILTRIAWTWKIYIDIIRNAFLFTIASLP